VNPVWSPDGTRLLYRVGGGREAAVHVAMKPAFAVGNPELVSTEGLLLVRGNVPREYDIAADGKRFVVATVAAGSGSSGNTPQIEVVLNWVEELKQRVPTK
jgi:hypothetical protein